MKGSKGDTDGAGYEHVGGCKKMVCAPACLSYLPSRVGEGWIIVRGVLFLA